MKHQSPNPVHPRLRGELMTPVEFWSQVIGSSPLTRGTLNGRPRSREDFRFIPAYAGNSSPLLIVCPTKNGSSPLTRGTHLIDPIVNTLCRFIPAYAGNSVNGTLQSQGQTVHPRLRGELLGYVQNLTFLFGSSPLTRGTRLS